MRMWLFCLYVLMCEICFSTQIFAVAEIPKIPPLNLEILKSEIRSSPDSRLSKVASELLMLLYNKGLSGEPISEEDLRKAQLSPKSLKNAQSLLLSPDSQNFE